MIPITEYAGRDVAVYGLGRTGLSAAKALAAGGARVHAWDDGDAARAKAEAEGVNVSDINKRDWQKFAALVLSPGIPYRFPQPHRLVRMAEMMNVPVVGDMELFARAVQALRNWQRIHLFTSEHEVALSHRQNFCRLARQQFTVGADFVGLWVHLNLRQGVVQYHV